MSSRRYFQTCCSSLILTIWFILYLFVTQLWKYFVFLSPWLAQRSLDHWAHIRASLSKSSFILDFSYLTRELFPLIKASSLALISICFFWTRSCLMLPNTFMFHQIRSLPKFSTFVEISLSISTLNQWFQAAWTTSSQPGFDNHISSNRKRFLSRWNI